MNESDLNILLKFEEINRTHLLRDLQTLIEKKQKFDTQYYLLNTKFLSQKATLEDAPYLKYRAIESKKILKNIQSIEQQITDLKEQLQIQVGQEKVYQTFIDNLNHDKKKQLEKKQEDQAEIYNIFKYNINSSK